MHLTVVVPTKDRPERLLETLQALVAASADVPGWEAVVVDDGGAPGSTGPAERWAAEAAAPVRIVHQASRGPSAARNRGAREARGRVLVFLDDDAIVSPGFLVRHLHAVDGNPRSWVVGRTILPAELKATPFGRYRYARSETFHERYAPQGLQETDGITAQNLALPAADFARLGGFDEGFTLAGCEDHELGQRARAAGIRVLYDPENVVLHMDWAVSFDRYCERQRTYAISDVRIFRMQGDAAVRAPLVRACAPIARTDGAGLIARKLLKRVLATGPGRAVLRGCAALAERVAPDTAWSHRAYDAAIAVAIFRGVREGLRRYPETVG